MSDRTRLDIEQILKDDILVARARLDVSKKSFDETMRNLPTGLPVPDGTMHIHQVSADHRAALNEVREALRRFNDFILNGVMPEGI